MAKKILLLPSWYPNTNNKHGSYFLEQAQFLSEHKFDVKVLMVEELQTKNFYFQCIKRWFKRLPYRLSQTYLEQNPSAYSFPLIIQKSWSDEKKLRQLDKAYLNAFKELAATCNWFPDVVHVQSVYKYGVSSYKVAKANNLPLVVIEHSPFKLSLYNKTYQERIKNLFNYASRIAGVSSYHKSCLASIDAAKRIEVVWNLTDEQKFLNKPSLNKTNHFIITTVLRVSAIKDPITFFDAILEFVDSYSGTREVEVHVVGMSCLQELTNLKEIDSNDITKYTKLNSVLHFHSWLDRSQMTELYQKSAVFVSTSLEESFGLSIREAMLCGAVVIATKSGGPEDTVKQDTGFLVEIGDAEAIAKHLKKIYDGNVNFDRTQLRDFVISQSGRKAFLKRMEKLYDV